MNYYVKAFLALFVVLTLMACGKNNTPSTNEPTDHSSEEPIPPEQFPDQFLSSNFEKLYNQTSESLQEMVSLKQLETLGNDFIKDVESFELVSEMPINNLTEYQWLSDGGDKGIRAHFDDEGIIHALLLVPITSASDSDENYTENTYQMPMTGEWFTFWGGTNELVNYHYSLEVQRYAYDLLIVQDRKTFEGDPADNESYYAFGESVVAPADGIVISVENNIPDNTPTVDTNTGQPLGNHVIIKHENNEYSVIAHLQEGSLEVSQGDNVTAGDVLGKVGNSGNSSEPHIHFHVADGPDWEEATSIRIKLESGEEPIRGDKVTGYE